MNNKKMIAVFMALGMTLFTAPWSKGSMNSNEIITKSAVIITGFTERKKKGI